MRFSKFLPKGKLKMRDSLFGYMMILTVVILVVIALGMIMLGTFAKPSDTISNTLELQMGVFEKEITSHHEELAMRGASLSSETSRILSYYLRENGIDFEDLISIGTIGLMKAINTFKTDKNIKLATYASRCIENEILMQLRRNSKIKNEVSIDEPLNKDGDGNELLLSDVLGTDVDITSKRLEDAVDMQLLKVAISKLNEREKYIMNLRFGIDGIQKEKTQKEVADMLGISQSYISRLEKRIMQKLRREILRQTS